MVMPNTIMTTIKDIEKLYRASIKAHYNPNTDDEMDERDQVPPSPPLLPNVIH